MTTNDSNTNNSAEYLAGYAQGVYEEELKRLFNSRASSSRKLEVKAEFSDCVFGEARLTTNGRQGGDAGHGGFVEIVIEGFDVKVDQEENKITIATQGDAEGRALVALLEKVCADGVSLLC